MHEHFHRLMRRKINDEQLIKSVHVMSVKS